MKIKEIAFTVLPVSDLVRARNFYERVLKLEPTSIFEEGDMGFVEYDIAGGTLAIGCGAPIFKPSRDGGAIALEVDSFGDAISELEGNGCSFVMEPHETPVCRMATIADPDGNYIIIHKRKEA